MRTQAHRGLQTRQARDTKNFSFWNPESIIAAYRVEVLEAVAAHAAGHAEDKSVLKAANNLLRVCPFKVACSSNYVYRYKDIAYAPTLPGNIAGNEDEGNLEDAAGAGDAAFSDMYEGEVSTVAIFCHDLCLLSLYLTVCFGLTLQTLLEMIWLRKM